MEPFITQSGRRGFKVTFHWRGKTSALAQLTFLLELNCWGNSITQDTFYASHQNRQISIRYQKWVVGSEMMLRTRSPLNLTDWQHLNLSRPPMRDLIDFPDSCPSDSTEWTVVEGFQLMRVKA